jgi:hypothetical protein
MATKRWIGSTSGDQDTAANWSSGTLPANGDNLLFDSSAVGDLTSGSPRKSPSHHIGPDFIRAIGTSTTPVVMNYDLKGDEFTLDNRRGFFNVELLTETTVVKNIPKGDACTIDGSMTTCTVTASGGKLTFGTSTDIQTLVISPSDPSGGVLEVDIQGGDVDNLYVTGNTRLSCSVSPDNVYVSGNDCHVTMKASFGGSNEVIVSGGQLFVDKTNPTIGASGTVSISRGSLTLLPSVETWILASSGTVSLMPSGVLDTADGSVPVATGTVTNYGGLWKMQTPSTITVQTDTKLSSTSGRSLDFSVAANSGHVPTVLW